MNDLEVVIRTTLLVLGFVTMTLGAWHLRVYGKDILLPDLALFLGGLLICLASGFKNPEFYIAGSISALVALVVWNVRAPIVVRAERKSLTLDELFD